MHLFDNKMLGIVADICFGKISLTMFLLFPCCTWKLPTVLIYYINNILQLSSQMQKESMCNKNAILVMLSRVEAGSFSKVREREKNRFCAQSSPDGTPVGGILV